MAKYVATYVKSDSGDHFTKNLVSDPHEWTKEKAKEICGALNASATEKDGHRCYFTMKPFKRGVAVVCESHK